MWVYCSQGAHSDWSRTEVIPVFLSGGYNRRTAMMFYAGGLASSVVFFKENLSAIHHS